VLEAFVYFFRAEHIIQADPRAQLLIFFRVVIWDIFGF